MHRLNARIITADDHPAWMRVTRAGCLGGAFCDANQWMDHEGADCVVWVPPVRYLLPDNERNQIRIEYKTKKPERRYWLAQDVSYKHPFDHPHIDGDGSLKRGRRVIYTDYTEWGAGTVLYGFVDKKSDIHALGYINPQASILQNYPYGLAAGCAVFFNRYGPMKRRPVHAAPGFQEDLDYSSLPPDVPVREITIWDYEVCA